MISIFGVPHTIIPDNGPKFSGQPYRQLMQAHGINHVTSSPHHAKSHGFIERTIRTVKSFMRKSPLYYHHALVAPHNPVRTKSPITSRIDV